MRRPKEREESTLRDLGGMVLSVGKSSCGGLCTHEAALLPVEVEGPLENRLCLRGATGRLSKAMAQEAGLWMPTHQEAIELWRASTTNKSAGLVEVGGVYMPPE